MAEEMIKEEAFQELEKIQDLQCRMLLLRHCLNAKYLHLARTLGPDSSHNALAKVDRLVKKALFKILDQVPGDSDEDIMLEASLPYPWVALAFICYKSRDLLTTMLQPQPQC